jgi:endonuclease-8
VPEGDTIHKIAGFLAPRLREQTIVSVAMADRSAAGRLAGRRVADVLARGKHLFIELDDATAIRSHLGMWGSWHRYAHDEPWKKPRSQASLVITTAADDYVCFNAKEVEIVRAPSVRGRIVHGRLGPDLIADEFDPVLLVRRAREFLGGDTLLADVLLDQRVASGIGNVYKSEVLFIERLAPATKLGDVSDAVLARCFDTAAELLQKNLGGGKRVTRFENDEAGSLWVYGRARQPCHDCDTPIASARTGRHQRSTYWCPRCQSAERGPRACLTP